MAGQRSRSVQPVLVRHIRQPPARLSVGVDPLRSRRRPADGAGLGRGRLVRLDGFVDSAAVHDPGFGRGLRNYTGVGGAVEVPAPFGTLLAVEWGYGFRGVNANGTLGTQVVRVSGYKVF